MSSSAYFPRNMTLKYKMQLSEGSWGKILHFKSGTLFLEGRIFSGDLSLEAIHRSSGSSFRDFFVKTTKESWEPFWNHSMAFTRWGTANAEMKTGTIALSPHVAQRVRVWNTRMTEIDAPGILERVLSIHLHHPIHSLIRLSSCPTSKDKQDHLTNCTDTVLWEGW